MRRYRSEKTSFTTFSEGLAVVLSLLCCIAAFEREEWKKNDRLRAEALMRVDYAFAQNKVGESKLPSPLQRELVSFMVVRPEVMCASGLHVYKFSTNRLVSWRVNSNCDYVWHVLDKDLN